MNATRSLVACLVLLPISALAQEPSPGLTQNGESYAHDASKSSFKLPKDWEATKPDVIGSISKLATRFPDKGVEATLTWSPLLGKMDEALDLEMIELTQKYGKDKVTKKDPITVANKPVFVIVVDEGTTRDVPGRQGKDTGVIFLFEAGPDERNRWKIKVRGSYGRKDAAEGQKLVESLLQNFQW